MANEPGVGRFLGIHPAFVDDGYHIAPKYDSCSEPEATGRPAEQTCAGVVSAKLGEAKSSMSDLPCMYDETYADSGDLLSGAPKGGDRPDNPVHPDPKE